jgi:hypothetical protein
VVLLYPSLSLRREVAHVIAVWDRPPGGASVPGSTPVTPPGGPQSCLAAAGALPHDSNSESPHEHDFDKARGSLLRVSGPGSLMAEATLITFGPGRTEGLKARGTPVSEKS